MVSQLIAPVPNSMKDCNGCGKCCIKYSNGQLSAEKHEIENWEEARPDIFQYTHNGKIWVDPKSKEPLQLCPFLNKQDNSSIYTCDIYFDRPNDCRYYPSTLQEMIADECEMIEKKDVQNPAHAQQALELIMSDSWHQ